MRIKPTTQPAAETIANPSTARVLAAAHEEPVERSSEIIATATSVANTIVVLITSARTV
jgi:hypothetical protein